jgi:hypothetical protein
MELIIANKEKRKDFLDFYKKQYNHDLKKRYPVGHAEEDFVRQVSP